MTPGAAITTILGENGPIARTLGTAYEPRDEQLRMAALVEQCLADRSHLLVEAGTGVGKSFAYLVPALVRAAAMQETVVVATNTIALQEQLVGKDIPMLQAALGELGQCKAVLVKGRGNYVSLRRLKLASERQDRLLPDAASRRSLHQIEDWAYETDDGTLSTLPPLDRPGVWDKVQSDHANCMGRKCPTYNECFYQKARREMEGARLLICNHALFFSDMALRMRGTGFLPEYHHVILDEAHGVEDVASDHFGVSLTEGRVAHLLSTLYHQKTGKGYLSQLELATGDIAPIERAVSRVMEAERAARSLFDDVVRLVEAGGAPGGRIRRADAVPNPLTPAMNDVVLALKRVKDLVDQEPDRYEITAYIQRASDIADAAEALVSQTMESYVYWAETKDADESSRFSTRVKLACSPIEVGPMLREHLFGKEHSVVLTSATLSTRKVDPEAPVEHQETAFHHTLSRLGCEGARTVQLGSPFDHAAQVELFVDTTVPQPGSGRSRATRPTSGEPEESFEDAIASRVHDHVIATDGGAFVLFTSFALLNRTANRLGPGFMAMGMDVFVQGRSVPRGVMLERFRASQRGVLFGAASFWQGVDVRGSALRNVIITRLPFDPPDRPIVEARSERIREKGGDPFRDDALPRAVIRFKQGFGRLIRSAEDRGRVVVLDPRIVTAGYGRAFLSAVPEGVNVRRLPEPRDPW
jgi:ATP-dependent DNA helicase DinG